MPLSYVEAATLNPDALCITDPVICIQSPGPRWWKSAWRTSWSAGGPKGCCQHGGKRPLELV